MKDNIQLLNKYLCAIAKERITYPLKENHSINKLVILAAKMQFPLYLLKEKVEKDIKSIIKDGNEKEVNEVINFHKQENELKTKLREYVANKEFEKAASTRNNINHINKIKLEKIAGINKFQEGFIYSKMHS